MLKRILWPLSALLILPSATQAAEPPPPTATTPADEPPGASPDAPKSSAAAAEVAPSDAAPAPPPLTTPPEIAPRHDPGPLPPMPPPVDSLTPATPPPSPDSFPLAKDGHPLAGWHNGIFYVRDYNDEFRLYLQARGQVDTYAFFGPGVSDTTLKPTMFLRRIRPELSGEILKRWQFFIAGDFGATAVDAAGQTARVSAAPTDVFVNYKADGLFNVMVGQYNAPFTMSNRTSDKYVSFMERPLAVRVVGIPSNKEIGAMFWGQTEDKYWYYSAGVFNGDGQNRPNADGNVDFMARTFVRPLAGGSDATLKNLQIGASFRYGQRDPKFVYYDYPAMTTQAGYAFWRPTYAGSAGTNHVIPSGAQTGVGGELFLPISIIGLSSDFVYISNQTREAADGSQTAPQGRRGDLKGFSYYVQLSVWPWGKRDINGIPGNDGPAHVDFAKADPETPAQGLELMARWEQLKLTYDSASRANTTPDTKNIDGDIKVNTFGLGLNYWATKHLRVGANYIFNMFPDSAPTSTPTQRAFAPGNTLKAGVNDSARNSAHSLHELTFRVGVSL